MVVRVRFRVRGLGFGAWGSGLRVWDLRISVWCLGFGDSGVYSLGFKGLALRAYGLRVQGL